MKQLIPVNDYGIFCDDLDRVTGDRVYIVGTKSAVNIGHSANLRQRLLSLSIGSSVQYDKLWYSDQCSNACSVETALHQRFKNREIKSEWFDITFDEAVEAAREQRYEKDFRNAPAFQIDETFVRSFCPDACSIADREGFRIVTQGSDFWFEHDDYGIASPNFLLALGMG